MARDYSVNRQTVDSDQYVYREERDLSKTRVDWAEISKDLTKTITDIRDDRQKRKDEIDKAQRESMNQLGEYDQYNNKGLNESVLEGSEWSKNALATQYDLMRRGLISPSEYKRFEQRTKDSFGALKGNLDNFAKHYDEATLRVQNGESNIGEMAINGSLSGLANLGQYELSGNPATGELCYVKTGINPETGEPYDPKNPANQISLGVINARINQKMNYVSASDAALKEVEKLGTVIDADVLAQQGVKTMEDWRLLDNSEEMMDRMVGVITNSQSQQLNILQEAGYTADDFTQDPDVAASDPSKILMTPNPDKSGSFLFEFNDEQTALIDKNARLAVEAQISQKAGFTKGFQKQQESAIEAGRSVQIDEGRGYFTSLKDFVTATGRKAGSGAQNLVNEINKGLEEGEAVYQNIKRVVDPDGVITSFELTREDGEPLVVDVEGLSPQDAMRELWSATTPDNAINWETLIGEEPGLLENFPDTYGTGEASGQGQLTEYAGVNISSPSDQLDGQTPTEYIESELGGTLGRGGVDTNVQVKKVYEKIISAALPSQMYDDIGADAGIRVTVDGDDINITVGSSSTTIEDAWGDWVPGQETKDYTINQLDVIEDLIAEERTKLQDKRAGRSGGGGGGSGPAPSDIRIKNNITLVGTSPNGHNIYTFMYKDPSKHLEGVYQGVMAQEVPHATVQVGEELWVDYNKLDVDFIKVS